MAIERGSWVVPVGSTWRPWVATPGEVLLTDGTPQIYTARVGGDTPPVQWVAACSIEASQRATALLLERLSPVDAAFYKANGTIMRPSTLWPGMHYILRTNKRVLVINQGRLAAELCVEVANGEPEADRLMTMLDWIEIDERRLWQMANVTGSWVPGQGPTVTERDAPTEDRSLFFSSPTPATVAVPLPHPLPKWPGIVLIAVGFGTAALIAIGTWLGYLA